MNERLKKIMLIVIGVFVVFFLFLFMLSACKKKLTPEKLESEIVEKTKDYYSFNEDELPSDGMVLTLSLGDLIAKGIIDELEGILEKNTNCSGNIIIENNNGYYMYSKIKVPGVLLEAGFISNSNDNYKIRQKDYRDKLLNNVVSGIEEYFNLGN